MENTKNKADIFDSMSIRSRFVNVWITSFEAGQGGIIKKIRDFFSDLFSGRVYRNFLSNETGNLDGDGMTINNKGKKIKSLSPIIPSSNPVPAELKQQECQKAMEEAFRRVQKKTFRERLRDSFDLYGKDVD